MPKEPTMILNISGEILAMMLAGVCSATPTPPGAETALPLSHTTAPPPATDTPIPTPAPTEIELPSAFTDEFGVPMALVPAGPFEMGSKTGEDDEQPVHTVALDAFYIDLFEVTNARYTECEGAGICEPTTDTTAFDSS